MLYLGTAFLGMKNTLNVTPTNVSDIDSITIKNGIFDELFLTKNTNYLITADIPKDWDYDTIIHALFQNSLHAGNVEYTATQVSKMRIKRREYGTYNWMTLFEIPINSRNDFKFERFDRFARSETKYEYALVPVMNLVEGNLNINTIKSSFKGVYIIEKDQAFSTTLDINYTTQRNRTASIINTVNRKYPFVISNGTNDYETISLSATFIEYDSISKDWHLGKDAFDYRKSFLNFLNNGNIKIIKMPYTGEIWMASITGDPIANSPNGHPEKITSTVNLVEVGSTLSSSDMYNNNFIDVNIEGS